VALPTAVAVKFQWHLFVSKSINTEKHGQCKKFKKNAGNVNHSPILLTCSLPLDFSISATCHNTVTYEECR